MQRNIYNIIQEFLVVAFVLKIGQECSVVSVADISTRKVIHLPVASGSLRHSLGTKENMPQYNPYKTARHFIGRSLIV